VKIDPDTPDKMRTTAEDLGESAGRLVDLGGSLASQPLFEIDRQLFGAKGEVFASDRRVTFRSDRSLGKLKESKEFPYASVEDIGFDGAAPWIRWTFRGAPGSFDVELVNYTGRNGLNASQIVWYDVETYPARSGLFYGAVGRIVAGSAVSARFDHPASVSRSIEDAVTTFEESPGLVSESLSQPNPFHLWYGVYTGFCAFLAGTMLAGDVTTGSWLELFRDLDGFYARVIVRFLKEIDDSSQAILSKESAINNLSDQFDRLTLLWYVRQIARLHFADRHLSAEEIRPWSLSILTPKALLAGNRLGIRLRERELYEEQLGALRE